MTREEKITQMNSEIKEGTADLPNGCGLYWKLEEQGRVYYSDECGPVFPIWNTATVNQSTLLAAMCKEAELMYYETYKKRKEAKNE